MSGRNIVFTFHFKTKLNASILSSYFIYIISISSKL